jgi:outer membrane protein assembly factor BamB
MKYSVRLPMRSVFVAVSLIGLTMVGAPQAPVVLAAAPLPSARPTTPAPIPPPSPTNPGASAGQSWTTFGYNSQRTGYNPTEATLSPQTVPQMALHWSVDLGAPILTQPILYNGLVFVGTLSGSFVALNALTGATVWAIQTPTTTTACQDFYVSNGTVGVINTPTIDRTANRIFFVAGDGTLHALDVATGQELPGYPLQILDPANAAPQTVVWSSPTLLQSPLGAVSQLYITTASTCDILPFHGQVISVATNTATVANRWFTNGADGPSGGGIWGWGGLSLEPNLSALYGASGNALPDPEDFPNSDAVIELNPQLQLVAANAPTLGVGTDRDFGATPVVYQTPGCPPRIAAMNKTGVLFVYDRSSIGNGPTQAIQISNPLVSHGHFVGLPAFDPVLNQLYLGSTDDAVAGPYQHGLIALGVQADCSLGLAWQQQVGIPAQLPYDPVIPPVVANGVVYYATGIASQVYAFNTATGATLWSSGALLQAGIYAPPMVAGGQLIVGGLDNKLYAFGL